MYGFSAENYHLQPPPERQPYQWLYAKTNRKNPDETHLLLYHLIDVGQVALALWRHVVGAGFQQRIAHELGFSAEAAGRFIAFIAALHDLGKASPSYQNKYSTDRLKGKLNEAGLRFAWGKHPYDKFNAKTADPRTSHAHVTTKTLPQLLIKYCNLQQQFAQELAQALGGHHGKWPVHGDTDTIDDTPCPAWHEARSDLLYELRSVFQPPQIADWIADPVERNHFLTVLSGLTSVADWIGSRDDDNAFPLVDSVLTTRIYAEKSQQQAESILRDLGWIGWQPIGSTLDFSAMFDYLVPDKPVTPHTMQQEIIDHTASLNTPALVIIEAPTGSGKTEAAFYIADTLLQAQGGRGLYIAMPTQATGNQMFDRTAEFLGQRYPQAWVNLQLAHGQAIYDEAYQEMQLGLIGEQNENKSGRVVAMSWFNEKSKRTLLAPFWRWNG